MSEIFRRRETKYEIDEASYHHLRKEVARHLPLFEFKSNRPYTYITTVYFDTKTLKFFNRARKYYDDSLKLRVKEYFYRLDGMPPDVYSHCFVEIKQRKRGHVNKRRIRIPKRLLSPLFDRQDIWDELVATYEGIEHEFAVYDIYKDLKRFLDFYEVNPYSIINYRRVVYQKEERTLRVTFDDRLKVYAPVVGLYDSIKALTPEHMGLPIRKIPTRIMEIKCQAEYPLWLEKALGSHIPRKISKFTTSIDFLHHYLNKNGEPEVGSRMSSAAGILPECHADLIPDNRPEGETSRSGSINL